MKTIKLSFLFALIILTSLSVDAQIDISKIKIPEKLPNVTLPTSSNSATGLSESDIINGLKEALTKGANIASSQLNKTNGYNLNPKVRIPFPQDCKKVADNLRALGYGKKVDEFEVRLNRAAEQAAKEAAPIFTNSIKQMSITDAKNILTGSDTAATAYLRKTTYSSLFNAFTPHVKKALESTMAAKMWKELTTIYNKLPTTRTKVQTDLIGYTTNKGLQGLFLLVSDEEIKIRKDPMARTSEILKKVFGNNQR